MFVTGIISVLLARNTKGVVLICLIKEKKVHSDVVTKATKDALQRRGVTIEAVAEIVYEMQVPYNART